MKFKMLLSLMLLTISTTSTARSFLDEKTGVKECDESVREFYSCQVKKHGDEDIANSIALMLVGQHRQLMKGRNAISKEDMKKSCLIQTKKIRKEGC